MSRVEKIAQINIWCCKVLTCVRTTRFNQSTSYSTNLWNTANTSHRRGPHGDAHHDNPCTFTVSHACTCWNSAHFEVCMSRVCSHHDMVTWTIHDGMQPSLGETNAQTNKQTIFTSTHNPHHTFGLWHVCINNARHVVWRRVTWLQTQGEIRHQHKLLLQSEKKATTSQVETNSAMGVISM